MAEYLVDGRTLTDIADAIRSKTGTTDPMTPEEMPERINSLSGYEFYDVFWDIFQKEGNRTDYSYAFAGQGWSADGAGFPFPNCRPKHLIKPVDASYMFYKSSLGGDLEYWASDIANGIDWSDTTTIANCFQNNTSITKIGQIGASFTMVYAFDGCTNLEFVGDLTLPETLSPYTYMASFRGCSNLISLGLTGTIVHNFSVADSPLLNEWSLHDILEHLADKTEQTNTEWTVTLGETNLAKLTDEDIAVATEKGWTVL